MLGGLVCVSQTQFLIGGNFVRIIETVQLSTQIVRKKKANMAQNDQERKPYIVYMTEEQKEITCGIFNFHGWDIDIHSDMKL